MRALLRRVPWEVRIVNGVLQQVMSMLSAATMSVVKGAPAGVLLPVTMSCAHCLLLSAAAVAAAASIYYVIVITTSQSVNVARHIFLYLGLVV